MKKVAIIGTVGIPACYGGFESLVENLTKNSSKQIRYSVFCSSHHYQEKMEEYNNAELLYLPLKANGMQSIPYDIFSLFKCFKLKPDVVLILGVSGCIFLPIFKLISRAKVVTNIDGLEWKRDKWGWAIKKFLKISEKIAVKFSDVVVTDNKAIGDYVYTEYGKYNVTIAYGGDHAIRNSLDEGKLKSEFSDYALGLCRIEPENNVEMILDAFSKISKKIKFVGNWESSSFGKELRNKYGSFENIELLDPIYDLDRLYRLRKSCSLYLHGHSAGGTNPSLVEMMHFGIPVLAFDCSFNRYSTDDKALYFKDEKQLREIIDSTSEEDLAKNAYYMEQIALKRYTWSEISRLYELTY
ncbi:DUF1972 domain-containing protein [Vibrio parahaemolyticus]